MNNQKNITTTQAQDAIKAALLERLDMAQDALCGIGDALDGLQEKLNPAPAPLRDTIDPNAAYLRHKLHEPMEALFTAADEVGRAAHSMRFLAKRIVPSPGCRNAKAWGQMVELFSSHLSAQESLAQDALNALCHAARLLSLAVTFAEADALPDEAAEVSCHE